MYRMYSYAMPLHIEDANTMLAYYKMDPLIGAEIKEHNVFKSSKFLVIDFNIKLAGNENQLGQ